MRCAFPTAAVIPGEMAFPWTTAIIYRNQSRPTIITFSNQCSRLSFQLQRNRKVKQQHTGTIEKRKSMNSETDFVISREVISPFSGLTIINKQFFLFLVARFDWWVSHSWRITPLPCCLHEIFFMLSTDDNESHCLIVVQYIMTARRRGSIIVTQRTKPSKSLHHWSVLAQFHSSKQMHNPGMVE